MDKKVVEFDIGSMWPVALAFIVTGIAIAYGLNVMGDIKSEVVTDNLAANCGLNSTGGTGGTIAYTACPAEYNATSDAVTGIAKFPAKFGIIATIVVAAIIIGIIIRYFRA